MEIVGMYEYGTKDLIGHGAFAVVFKGRHRMRPTQTVAIKAITKKNLAKSQSLLSKEIRILKELTTLQHENLVALLDCKETHSHVYLVMEYCNGGDLADYLHAKGTLSEDTIRLFLRQLAGAMKAMVSKDVVHRDLKPQNILLSHDGRKKHPAPKHIRLKIADFGFARFLQDGNMAITLCGSPMYMAPEVIMSLQYNSKADLWSLGTIVYQCLSGKAPFQAPTPTALKLHYERHPKLAPLIPNGTSRELADLLLCLLKRDARERIDFDAFFHHPFLRPSHTAAAKSPPTTPVEAVAAATTAASPPKMGRGVSPSGSPITKPMAMPPSQEVIREKASASNTPTPKNSAPSPTGPGVLPPSPIVARPAQSPGPLREYVVDQQRRQSSGSPPDQVADDFVIVPVNLTQDAAALKRKNDIRNKASPVPLRRHTVAGAPRPQSLPVNTEPVPVPSQKLTYQQIQQSLIRSRSKSGDSVSAMSGISSASGGSTLGPLPEEGGATNKLTAGASPSKNPRSRAASLSSPASSPKSPGLLKTRKVSAPPIPDISQLDPPQLQYTMGTPPMGHRRRTSSSSSCGTPPPNHWQVSPSRLTSVVPASLPSPVRRSSSQTSTTNFPNVPCLSPILGSPNKGQDGAMAAAPHSEGASSTALMQWDSSTQRSLSASGRAITVPANLSTEANFKRRSAEIQFTGGRNVVLNYPGNVPGAAGLPPLGGGGDVFERSSSLSCLQRRHSNAGKENLAPMLMPEMPEMMPPPALSEETLLAPEHNEVLAKIKFVEVLVDTIIEVARCKAAPLSVISETMAEKAAAGDVTTGEWDNSSPLHRRLQQLLLYMRCLHLLSQTLEFARAELKSKRLKPSTTVKNVLAFLNERFRHCISMTKMLNAENLLEQCGIDTENTDVNATADQILYTYAVEQCQSAALDELFGNPGECFQRYHGAHILLHALQYQTQNPEQKNALTKYKDAVEKRLRILEEQGFVQTFQTLNH